MVEKHTYHKAQAPGRDVIKQRWDRLGVGKEISCNETKQGKKDKDLRKEARGREGKRKGTKRENSREEKQSKRSALNDIHESQQQTLYIAQVKWLNVEEAYMNKVEDQRYVRRGSKRQNRKEMK